jgi:plastocyanin
VEGSGVKTELTGGPTVRRLIVVVVATASGAILAGCGSDEKKDTTGSPSGATVHLEADNFYFKPTDIKLAPDEPATVVVKNEGEAKHNLTAEGLGVDKDIEPGATAEVPVTPKAGTYPFHCEYHPDKMKGTITVA